MLTKLLTSVNKNSFLTSILHFCLEADDKKISQTVCLELVRPPMPGWMQNPSLQLGYPSY